MLKGKRPRQGGRVSRTRLVVDYYVVSDAASMKPEALFSEANYLRLTATPAGKGHAVAKRRQGRFNLIPAGSRHIMDESPATGGLSHGLGHFRPADIHFYIAGIARPGKFSDPLHPPIFGVVI